MNRSDAIDLPQSSGRTVMTACRVYRFGPPEVIKVEQVECPVPGPGQVLVRVSAAGVGPWDAWIRAGRSALPQPLPLTLGSDISGEIVAIGPQVAGFHPGDQVFGVTNARFTGGYAEFALAEVSMIAALPPRIGHIEAASLPVVSVTAQQAIERAGISAGKTLLVHGAAGSVGSIVVQLAHGIGARVIATARQRDVERLRELGADRVLDYRKERFEEAISGGVDAVVDLVGGETQTRSFSVLRPGGRLISAVSHPDQALAQRHRVTAVFFLVEVTTQSLESIVALYCAGALSPDIGTVLPLAFARQAHEMLEGVRERPRGKIVLDVASGD